MHVNRSVAICVVFRMSSRRVVPPAMVCTVANCVVFSSTMRAMPPDSHCAWNVNRIAALWMVSWRVVARCVLCHLIAEMPQGRWSLPSLQAQTRICPIDKSEVFQPNTNAMGTTHKSGSVSLSLPSLMLLHLEGWLWVSAEFQIQIRSTDSCENLCFSLSQQIRLIFVSGHWSPSVSLSEVACLNSSTPQIPNCGAPVSKCHDKDHLYRDIGTLSIRWRFLQTESSSIYLDSQLLKVLSVLCRLIWFTTFQLVQWSSRWSIFCLNVWMFECLDVWILNVWMFGCLNVWMFGCLDVWMFECLDVWRN